MAEDEELDYYTPRQALKYLRIYADRGTLANIRVGTLRKLERSIKKFSEKELNISISGKNFKLMLKRIDFWLKVRTDRPTETRKEEEAVKHERARIMKREKIPDAMLALAEKRQKVISTIPLVGKTIAAADKIASNVFVATIKAIQTPRPGKIIVNLAKVFSIFQSDIGKVWSDYVKKNWKKIREKVKGLPQIPTVIGVSRSKRRQIHKIFSDATGLTYSKYA
jgi:hypothetical protein